MPSASLIRWQSVRGVELDEVEAAHRALGGSGRGRRFATQQLNHAYAVLLSSQFQGFCRDLYAECVDALVPSLQPIPLQATLRTLLERDLKLMTGNPNPGWIGADFGRLGLNFWPAMQTHSPRTLGRQKKLEDLNIWRNAIAHQDFRKLSAGSGVIPNLRLSQVQDWRSACNQLAISADAVCATYLTSATGVAPW